MRFEFEGKIISFKGEYINKYERQMWVSYKEGEERKRFPILTMKYDISTEKFEVFYTKGNKAELLCGFESRCTDFPCCHHYRVNPYNYNVYAGQYGLNQNAIQLTNSNGARGKLTFFPIPYYKFPTAITWMEKLSIWSIIIIFAL